MHRRFCITSMVRETAQQKNQLDDNGNCGPVQHFDSPFLNMDCTAFCQIRTTFVYSTESPFSNSYCHGPFTCTITQSAQSSVAIATQINGKFLEAFGFGISGTYTRTTQTANATARQLQLKPGQCGYFTFVPVRRDVCGTATSSSYSSSFGGGEVNSQCDNNYQSIGTTDGETIFVYTDCTTRAPLPMDGQDPVYQSPGVPLDRGTLDAMISLWQTAAAPQDSCDVSYKFFLDYFEIRGQGWTSDEEGVNGNNLKAAIAKCGAITDWNFELTPNDPTYQWYAHGNLPIGTKTCVGNAVVSAGGDRATQGDCHGAG